MIFWTADFFVVVPQVGDKAGREGLVDFLLTHLDMATEGEGDVPVDDVEVEAAPVDIAKVRLQRIGFGVLVLMSVILASESLQ